MGFFGNLWSGLTNGVREFVRDPIGKIKSVGTAVVNGIGKVKNVVGFIKKGRRLRPKYTRDRGFREKRSDTI